MGDPTFISLGENDRLARLLTGMMPEARIIRAPCLEVLGPLAEDPELRILVDPRSVRPCCVRRLGKLARGKKAQLGYFGLRGPDSGRGRVAPREAWNQREQLLAPDHRSETVRIFIALSRAHARERYTVQEAATALRMTTRHLHRWVAFEIDCSPHILIALARVNSVVSLLGDTKLSLSDIAALHQFADQSAMTRLFKTYVGTTPGAFRVEERRRNVRNRPKLVRKRL